MPTEAEKQARRKEFDGMTVETLRALLDHAYGRQEIAPAVKKPALVEIAMIEWEREQTTTEISRAAALAGVQKESETQRRAAPALDVVLWSPEYLDKNVGERKNINGLYDQITNCLEGPNGGLPASCVLGDMDSLRKLPEWLKRP